MKSFWSDNIRNLTPYVPGEQSHGRDFLKLNTNECPYPTSPAALQAIKEAANSDLRLYPDPEGKALRQTIAQMYGIGSENVFLGNGSDEVLGHVFHALLKHDRPVLFPDITYSFYLEYETRTFEGKSGRKIGGAECRKVKQCGVTDLVVAGSF